jgi:TatD DNase family protein
MSGPEEAAGSVPPPRLVDTHCHLADAAFLSDRAAAVDRAEQAGVVHTVVIGETPEAAAQALLLARADRRLSATAGLHPHEAKRWSPELAGWLASALSDPLVIAAGEMGLDYHYDHSPRSAQRTAFEAQLELARQANRAAVIHAREADDDVAAVLANHPHTVAIMHSFSSGPELLRAAVALGHYVSLSGMITFKSWRQDDLLRLVPLDRLLVETDAPYLAPVPYRGKRNEPAYVAETARRLGRIVGKSVEEIAAITCANAARVFGARVAPAH